MPRAIHSDADRAAIAFSGAALTLVLHLLMICPLVLGRGHPVRRHPEQEGASTSGIPALTVVDLEDPADRPEQQQKRSASAKLSSAPDPSRFLLPSGGFHLQANAAPAAIDDVDAKRTAPDGPAADDGEQAVMFGRYLGQVTSRIERAWLRPRTAIGGSSFTCLVQVEQDRERNVKEVMLKRCNGSTQWQLSLVHAIESASPFPAPPDPSVFSPTLTFQMTADAYVEGDASDGYEPATSASVGVAARVNSPAAP